MKIFNIKVSLLTTAFAVILGSVLVGLVLAATKVNLLTADGFAILAGSAISDPADGSVIVGNVGLHPTGGTAITEVTCADVTGTIYDNNSGYPGGGLCHVEDQALLIQAKADLVTAYNNARDQATTTVISADLGGSTLTPGVYGADSSMALTGTVILDGQGDPNAVFIFKAGSTLTINAASTVSLINQAQACNVFWQVGSSASLVGAASNFKGTIMAMGSISDASGSTVLGRLLARNGAVTLNSTDVTVPSTCLTAVAAAASQSSPILRGNITVTKLVINNSGGKKTIADFPLFVNGKSVVSGMTNSFLAPAPRYNVTETADPNYVRTFSGDCDENGGIGLSPNNNMFCVVTNNDIGETAVVPPLIDVVKVPSPLALPSGPGPVTYTYTLRNIGIVPVTDITMTGDTCSPIKLVSGDTNGDSKLDLSETWTYRCSTTLSKTHTNIVTTTGWANGVSAVDIANATVVVGVPVVPPLIHITKVPSPLVLSAGGGAVTYAYTVTNPGTAPLSNVSVSDDKCTGLPGRVVGTPGDLNKNNLLESTESWSFTCKSTLSKTTTNTGTAVGSANGLTAKDVAVVTVIVVPGLPNTGFAPGWSNGTWVAIIGAAILAVLLFLVKKKKQI